MNVPVDTALGALWWGAVTALGMVIGTALGVFTSFSHATVARTMSLGAGLLLSAASVELAAKALEIEPLNGIVALLIGAACFSGANAILATHGAKHRKRCGECVAQLRTADAPNSGAAIALGTAMDAVPEALVLGLTLRAHGLDLILLTAITLGNLPEALSAVAGMRAAKRRLGWIFGLWGGIAAATALLTAVGYMFADSLSERAVLLLQAFGAGTLLAMVAETMLPEAVHESPRFSGLMVAIGFTALLLLGALLRTP